MGQFQYSSIKSYMYILMVFATDKLLFDFYFMMHDDSHGVCVCGGGGGGGGGGGERGGVKRNVYIYGICY